MIICTYINCPKSHYIPLSWLVWQQVGASSQGRGGEGAENQLGTLFDGDGDITSGCICICIIYIYLHIVTSGDIQVGFEHVFSFSLIALVGIYIYTHIKQ
jgi:hypothetical protein